jgi:hypothetical protein
MSSIRSKTRDAIWIAIAIAGCVQSTNAATITGVTIVGGSSPGTFLRTNAVNSTLGAGPRSFFDAPNLVSLGFQATGPVDVVCQVSNSTGTTEYGLRALIANNGSMEGWQGFQMQLGFGVGSGFVLSTLADDLDFNAPTYDSFIEESGFSSLPFSSYSLNLQPDSAIWTFLPIIWPSGFATTMLRTLDVPDGLSSFHPSGLNEFTIRLTPIPVPEPAAIQIAAGMLLMLGACKSRMRFLQ